MKNHEIFKNEIFSLLTSKQIGEISDAAIIKDFEVNEIIYQRKEVAKNLYILLEGEVSLKVPGRNDISIESLSLEIEKISRHGTLFGTNLLFDVNRYIFEVTPWLEAFFRTPAISSKCCWGVFRSW